MRKLKKRRIQITMRINTELSVMKRDNLKGSPKRKWRANCVLGHQSISMLQERNWKKSLSK